jgi:hypothetical protein
MKREQNCNMKETFQVESQHEFHFGNRKTFKVPNVQSKVYWIKQCLSWMISRWLGRSWHESYTYGFFLGKLVWIHILTTYLVECYQGWKVETNVVESPIWNVKLGGLGLNSYDIDPIQHPFGGINTRNKPYRVSILLKLELKPWTYKNLKTRSSF